MQLYSIFAPLNFDRNSKTEINEWQISGSEADFIAAGYTLQRLSEVCTIKTGIKYGFQICHCDP